MTPELYPRGPTYRFCEGLPGVLFNACPLWKVYPETPQKGLRGLVTKDMFIRMISTHSAPGMHADAGPPGVDGRPRYATRPQEFARNLQTMRRIAGLTRAALAARAEIPLSSLKSYEMGRLWPPVLHAQVLADALGTRIPVLLGAEEHDAGTATQGLSPAELAEAARQIESQLEVLKRSLALAKASEQRWMSLAEAVNEGILLHDGKVIIDVNPRWTDMFGYTREAVLKRPIFDFIAPESRAKVVQHVTSGSSEPYEIFGLTVGGGKARVKVQARVLDNGLRIAAFEVVGRVPGR